MWLRGNDQRVKKSSCVRICGNVCGEMLPDTDEVLCGVAVGLESRRLPAMSYSSWETEWTCPRTPSSTAYPNRAPSPPFWCPSSAPPSMCGWLSLRITKTPSLATTICCRPSPLPESRRITNPDASRLHELHSLSSKTALPG